MYIYIYRERERDRYTYIYVYTLTPAWLVARGALPWTQEGVRNRTESAEPSRTEQCNSGAGPVPSVNTTSSCVVWGSLLSRCMFSYMECLDTLQTLSSLDTLSQKHFDNAINQAIGKRSGTYEASTCMCMCYTCAYMNNVIMCIYTHTCVYVCI